MDWYLFSIMLSGRNLLRLFVLYALYEIPGVNMCPIILLMIMLHIAHKSIIIRFLMADEQQFVVTDSALCVGKY